MLSVAFCAHLHVVDEPLKSRILQSPCPDHVPGPCRDRCIAAVLVCCHLIDALLWTKWPSDMRSFCGEIDATLLTCM